MRIFRLIVITLLCLPFPAIAGTLEDAREATNNYDYATALKLWQPLADQGNAEAQYNVGVIYGQAAGVKQDVPKALDLLLKSANQDYWEAEYFLGQMYARDGREKNMPEALKWYRKAAAQGDLQSQLDLAEIYMAGRDVPQDKAEALRWYRMAADQGQLQAQIMLVKGYKSGEGINKDLAEAYFWQSLAWKEITGDRTKSEDERDQAAFDRKALASQLTPEQLAAIDQRVQAWKRAPGVPGQKLSRFSLGYATEETEPATPADPFRDALDAQVRGDYETALKLILPLADQGNADAQRIVGDMYFAGQGVDQSNAVGLSWYEKAAAHSGDYQGKLASLYFEGSVVQQNNTEGLKWLRMSGNSGNDNSQRELGKIYEEGKITEQDYQEALFWYALPKSNTLGRMVEDENKVLDAMKHCTAEQIAAVQKRVLDWRPGETRTTGASHAPVRLYSWKAADNRWYFRLISGGYLGYPSPKDIFDKKLAISDVDKLVDELSKLPGVTSIQWVDRIPSDPNAPQVPGSEKLAYPPRDIKDVIVGNIRHLNLYTDPQL